MDVKDDAYREFQAKPVPKETVPYFDERRLDEWVHKKAIQKVIESYRVTDEHKEYLKSIGGNS